MEATEEERNLMTEETERRITTIGEVKQAINKLKYTSNTAPELHSTNAELLKVEIEFLLKNTYHNGKGLEDGRNTPRMGREYCRPSI
jgi:hypothetical protein